MRSVDREELATTVRRAIAEEHDLHLHALALLKTGTVPRTTSGKIQIEAKTDLRSRGIPSPDLADALMLTMTEGSTLGREIPRISPISYERQSPFAELG